MFLLNWLQEGGKYEPVFHELRQGLAWERLTFPEILFAQLENVNTGFLHMRRNSVINEDPGQEPDRRTGLSPDRRTGLSPERVGLAALKSFSHYQARQRGKHREAE